MGMLQREPGEAPLAFVRRHWCVCGPDGIEDSDRVARVMAVLARESPDLDPRSEVHAPDVPGVPRLRDRIDEIAQIPEFVRRYLPEVESDPRLHAMSFVDPLRLATDVLGIAVSPRVARAVRRGLRSMVSFDLTSLDAQGRLHGIEAIRWRVRWPDHARGTDVATEVGAGDGDPTVRI